MPEKDTGKQEEEEYGNDSHDDDDYEVKQRNQNQIWTGCKKFKTKYFYNCCQILQAYFFFFYSARYLHKLGNMTLCIIKYHCTKIILHTQPLPMEIH
jgi:hypothetical protein